MHARRLMVVTDETVLRDADFRAFFLRSPVGRMAVSAAPDGSFVFAEVNDAAASFFDMPREKMMGRTPRDLFEKTLADQIEQSFRNCARTKKTVTLNTLPRIHGGVRLQALVLNPVTDKAGTVHFIDVMARSDMLDGAQIQRERDDAMMLMTALFDASGFGLIVTDHHGRVVRVNDAFVEGYGWQREEILGELFTALIPPEEHELSLRLHHAFIDHGHHGSRELQMLRRDGTIADVLITTALMELSQKRRFMVTSVRDMTERKNMIRNLRRAKEEADSANRAKSSFLANMSHELRTPLNAVIGFTEIMKKGTFGAVENPKYVEYLSDIHFSACHLLEIINDVLDMSKIEAGRVELVECEVAVHEVLESVLRIMADRAAAGGVELDFRVQDSLPHLMADQRLLRQILINLVANAIKFSAAGKHVRIFAESAQGGGLRLTITDEGCGIPADKIAHVMEPFGQVQDPRHYAGQGTGLGLPLAKAMMDLHGGVLRLESEEGKGTVVTLDFPAERTLPLARS